MLRLAASVFLGMSLASASQALEPSVPGHLEPHHHVLYQNGYVRVIDTRLAPGQSTQPHSHPNPALIVFLSDSRLQISRDDGSAHSVQTNWGSVHWSEGVDVHRARNESDTTSRTVAVEVFSQPPAPTGTRLGRTIDPVLLENERVRVTKLHLEPDQILRATDAAPVILIGIGSGELVTLDGQNKKAFSAGTALWQDRKLGDLRNSGGSPLQAIHVQLKPRS